MLLLLLLLVRSDGLHALLCLRRWPRVGHWLEALGWVHHLRWPPREALWRPCAEKRLGGLDEDLRALLQALHERFLRTARLCAAVCAEEHRLVQGCLGEDVERLHAHVAEWEAHAERACRLDGHLHARAGAAQGGADLLHVLLVPRQRDRREQLDDADAAPRSVREGLNGPDYLPALRPGHPQAEPAPRPVEGQEHAQDRGRRPRDLHPRQQRGAPPHHHVGVGKRSVALRRVRLCRQRGHEAAPVGLVPSGGLLAAVLLPTRLAAGQLELQAAEPGPEDEPPRRVHVVVARLDQGVPEHGEEGAARHYALGLEDDGLLRGRLGEGVQHLQQQIADGEADRHRQGGLHGQADCPRLMAEPHA
mmetsp:Transcript_112516/g.350708  ORF Transcript_112516/g.350708 Transcript_112516/m.350708 type:complete len:362 (+) Transcript_112516:451-1536(+)